MRPWKEIITEAKDKKNMTAAEIRKAGEAALKDEQTKNKKEKQAQAQKSKNRYYKLAKKREKRKGEQLKFSIDQARKNAEARKKKELEDIKNKPRQAASAALSGIKTQTISSKDKDPTAYTKAVGNVASLAGGIAKAGIGYSVAKHKAKKAAAEAEKNDVESKIPEKKPRKSGLLGGRPKTPKTPKSSTTPSGVRTPVSYGGDNGTGTPEPKLLSPQRKRLVAATKRLPPSGGVPEGSAGPKPTSLGQRARKNPELKKRLIAQSNEEYSNWRDEFLIEQGLLFEVEDETNKTDKTEKKKIIDVMRGKNKIEINPTMKEEKDQEGGMVHNELATMERAVKTLRKKIKSPNQQLPAWVQSKISKAADYIDSVADYMSGETEPVSEECGCEDDGKKVLAMMIIKKAVDVKKKKNFQLNSGIIGEAKTAAWQREEGKSDKGGLNEKGRKSYERENPGSDLKAPQPKGGSRRDSFCARMSGMKKKLTSAKTANDPNSRINKSLRAWNC